jgi:hypothetical protein
MNIGEILRICSERTPTTGEIDAYRLAEGLGVEAALNSIAIHLAKRYEARELDFAAGDKIAMGLHSWNLLERDCLLPDPAYQVFLAFDEGEYRHNGDADDVNPEDKYTRPMIREILHGLDAV